MGLGVDTTSKTWRVELDEIMDLLHVNIIANTKVKIVKLKYYLGYLLHVKERLYLFAT